MPNCQRAGSYLENFGKRTRLITVVLYDIFHAVLYVLQDDRMPYSLT
jgi:hypothetical protein